MFASPFSEHHHGTECPEYKMLRFPGGEPQVKWNLAELRSEAQITIQMQRFDFPLLATAVDGIRRARPDIDLFLYIPYIPGARQDRVCQPGESLSAKVYADMINSLGFKDVITLDPHSDVLPALVNNLRIYPHGQILVKDNKGRLINKEFLEIYEEGDSVCEPYYVCAPDAGASKKVMDAMKRHAISVERNGRPVPEFVQGSKLRDVTTGELSGFDCNVDDFHGRRVLIMDDVNCNGGTFLGLATVLKQRNAGGVDLFTSHLDHFKGADNLHGSPVVDRYYTTNSNGPWEKAIQGHAFNIFSPSMAI